MSQRQQVLWSIGAAIAGMAFLTGIYLAIVSIAESPQYAVNLLWMDRFIVIPLIVGFGIQAALYVILKKKFFVPVSDIGPSGALTGASGTTSSLAMVACCAHHVTDVLPVLGLTAASAFLAEYRTTFMWVGLSMTILGIVFMGSILLRERRRAVQMLQSSVEALT